jgi:hypothetical protein
VFVMYALFLIEFVGSDSPYLNLTCMHKRFIWTYVRYANNEQNGEIYVH